MSDLVKVTAKDPISAMNQDGEVLSCQSR